MLRGGRRCSRDSWCILDKVFLSDDFENVFEMMCFFLSKFTTRAIMAFSRTRTLAVCFLFQGLSSVVMMLGNKKLSLLYPFPFLTIFIQNAIVGVVSLLLMALPFTGRLLGPHRRVEMWHFRTALPVGVLTTLVLTTSIVALRYSSVPLIVTFRNLTPIVCSLFEFFILGGVFTISSQTGLCFGVVGSWLYSVYDPPKIRMSSTASEKVESFSTGRVETSFGTAGDLDRLQEFGLLFVVANLILSAIVNIAERLTMDRLKKANSATVVNLIRIAVMAPILAGLSALFEDHCEATTLMAADFDAFWRRGGRIGSAIMVQGFGLSGGAGDAVRPRNFVPRLHFPPLPHHTTEIKFIQHRG